MSILLKKSKGFTLIEIAIVLIIIGLIIGGVLVGQDLIKSARIQAGISEVRGINTGVTTFTLKYKAIPGDFTNTLNWPGLISNADRSASCNGDGLITCHNTCANEANAWGEIFMFFQDLASAGYISMTTTTASNIIGAAVGATTIDDTYLLKSSLGSGNRYSVYSDGGKHYLHLASLTAGAATSGAWTATAGLTPGDAYQVDSKMDDGVPDAGSVYATAAIPATSTPVPAANCAASSLYVVAQSGTECALRIELQFQ